MNSNLNFKQKLINRVFNLARAVIKLTDKFPNKTSTRVIVNQLLRAITSIGANVIEAQAASSKRDFVNFLNHALKVQMKVNFGLHLPKI